MWNIMNIISIDIAIKNIVMNAPTGNIKFHCHNILKNQLKACPISIGKGITGRINNSKGNKMTVNTIEKLTRNTGLSNIAIVF